MKTILDLPLILSSLISSSALAFNLIGQVTAETQMTVVSEVQGVVQSIPLNGGEAMKQNQTIARIKS